MKIKDTRQKLVFTLFGLLIALSRLVLTGATGVGKTSQIGR
jgi:hypothetical protein